MFQDKIIYSTISFYMSYTTNSLQDVSVDSYDCALFELRTT